MTPPEVRLWVRLRNRPERGFVVRRQHPVGGYVLDFYCPEASLAIEVDGACHEYDAAVVKDTKRDAWLLLEEEIETLRVPAGDIMFDADAAAEFVIGEIRRRLRVPPVE